MSDENASSKDRLGSPSASNSPLEENVFDPVWLRAYTRRVNALKSSIFPEMVIKLTDNVPRGENAEDVASTYHAQDLGDTKEGEDDLHDFLVSFDSNEAGPSRLGVGRGKSHKQYKQMLRDRGELPSSDDENVEDEATRSEEEGKNEEEVFSISPVRYAMELPSSLSNPYIPSIYTHELDLEYEEDVTEVEKGKARFEYGRVSCAGLASKITFEEIMWMMEYYNLEGRWLRPRPYMRMHRFNIEGLPTPRMVLTNKLVELGFGSPMHTFLC